MMKILHRIMGLIVFAVLLGLAIVITMPAVSAEWWRVALNLAGERRVDGLLVGGVLLAVAFLFAVTGLRRKRREHFLSFDEEGGTVSISTEAIADYVAKLAGEFPSIQRMRPKVIPARKSIDIVVDVQIKAGPQIHEVCELLQKRIRETMTTGLGVSEVRRVEVSVRKIICEHRPD
jgi:uncharacterized alkaline shock family protein YloU